MNFMEMMKDTRTTSHFRDYAIAEIKIAYRIKEYLDPDPYFPPNNLNSATIVLLENDEIEEAIRRIIDKELYIDIESSNAYEDLIKESVAFANSFLEKEKNDIER